MSSLEENVMKKKHVSVHKHLYYIINVSLQIATESDEAGRLNSYYSYRMYSDRNSKENSEQK